MPAIKLALLREQTALLSNQFHQPDLAVRSIHSILDLYANRTQRHGQSGAPPPLIEAYHVPKPVRRQIVKELEPVVKDSPAEALDLCDSIWEQPYFEFKLIAASLIGKIPIETPEAITDRIFTWSLSCSEDRIQSALFTNGLEQLIKDHTGYLLDQISELLSDRDIEKQTIGLSALISIIGSKSFDKFPKLFRIINPMTRSIDPDLRPYMVEVIRQLADRTPKETAYLLRHNLYAPDNPDTAWLVRQSLRAFPVDIQEYLRVAL